MKLPESGGEGAGDEASAQPMPRIERMDDGSFRFTDYQPQQGTGPFNNDLGGLLSLFSQVMPGQGGGAMPGGGGQPAQETPQGRTRLAEMLINQGGGGGY